MHTILKSLFNFIILVYIIKYLSEIVIGLRTKKNNNHIIP